MSIATQTKIEKAVTLIERDSERERETLKCIRQCYLTKNEFYTVMSNDHDRKNKSKQSEQVRLKAHTSQLRMCLY
jgi:prephenate dehydrogenase